MTTTRQTRLPGAATETHRLRAPVGVGLFALLVSFALSWVPAFWSDEVATAQTTRIPVPALLRFLSTKDAVHGTYDLGIHAWAQLFGSSELSLRAPSALAVGVAAAGLVAVGRLLESDRLGGTAGLVFAVLPRTTSAGSEARSYALTAAVAVVLTLVLLLALRHRRAWLFVVYGVLAALGTAVFVYLGLLLAAHLVIVLTRTRDRRMHVAWLAASVAAVAVTSPLVVLVSGQKSQVAWLASQPVLNAWTVLVEPWFESGVPAAVVGWGVLVAGAIRWRRLVAAPAPLVAALAWVVVPTGLLLAANAVAGPLYTSRYLTFCEPGLALLLAVVMGTFGRRLAAALVVLLVVASAPTWAAQRTPFAKNGGSDLRQAAALVRDHAHPGDSVLFGKARTAALDPRQALAAYPESFAGLDDVALVTPFPASGRFGDRVLPVSGADGRVGDRLAARLESVDRLWFVVPTPTRSCDGLTALRPLTRDGLHVVATYPVHRTTVCELRR